MRCVDYTQQTLYRVQLAVGVVVATPRGSTRRRGVGNSCEFDRELGVSIEADPPTHFCNAIMLDFNSTLNLPLIVRLIVVSPHFRVPALAHCTAVQTSNPGTMLPPGGSCVAV